MLTLGFEEQLTLLSSYIRPDRQTMLFTATFPGRLRDVSSRWMGGHACTGAEGPEGDSVDSSSAATVIIRVNTVEIRPTDVEVPDAMQMAATAAMTVTAGLDMASTEGDVSEHATSTCHQSSQPADTTPTSSSNTSLSLTISRSIEQKVHVCAAHKKPRLLISYVTKIRDQEKLAKVRQGGPMIIFCTKIKTVSFVTNFLLKNGVVGVQQLHGQLPQQRREGVLADFKAVRCVT